MNKKNGFTLIELLVVIAIIGLLTSIVYAALGPIKLRSKDSAVKTQLANMKVQAEIYFDANNNSYAGICAASSDVRGFGGTAGPGLLKAAKDGTAITSTFNLSFTTAGGYNIVTCHDSTSGFAVEAPMSKSTSASPAMFCVDSKSVTAKDTTSPLTASDVIC